MAQSLKQTYDKLKKQYDDLAFQLAGLLAKKKMMEEQLSKVQEDIVAIVGERVPTDVVNALSKEIETRSQLLQEDIKIFEGVLAEFKIGVMQEEKTNYKDIFRGV